MNDISEKIDEVLKNPESLEKIMQLVGGMKNSSEESDAAEQQTGVAETTENPAVRDAPDIDPSMISTAMKLFEGYKSQDDKRIPLLCAIRPYLKDEERVHIDKAIKIVRLAKVARGAIENLSGGDLFV